MNGQRLTIYFVYEDQESSDLKEQHFSTLEESEDFEVEPPYIISDAGNIEVTSNDVPGITGMSYLENYEYESEDKELDLLYAPMVRYSIGDLSLLQRNTQKERESAIEGLVDAVVAGYNATDQTPLAVVSRTPPHGYYIGEAKETPFTAESLLDNEYQHLSWLSIFTPQMVRRYGRETLLSTPAWEVRELDDGATLIVCHADTVDWKADCQAIADHLGIPWYREII